MVNYSLRTRESPLVLWTQFNIVRERNPNCKMVKKVKLFCSFFFPISECANLELDFAKKETKSQEIWPPMLSQ